MYLPYRKNWGRRVAMCSKYCEIQIDTRYQKIKKNRRSSQMKDKNDKMVLTKTLKYKNWKPNEMMISFLWIYNQYPENYSIAEQYIYYSLHFLCLLNGILWQLKIVHAFKNVCKCVFFVPKRVFFRKGK